MISFNSKNYAQAGLEIAIAETNLNSELEAVKRLSLLLTNNPLFLRLLKSNFVSKEEKFNLLEAVVKPIVGKSLFYLILILNKRSSLALLPEILVEFIHLANNYLGIVCGFVFSAKELSESNQKRLESWLTKRLGKRVKLEYRLKPELVAGLRIELANDVIELSFASLLEGVSEALLKTKRGGRKWL